MKYRIHLFILSLLFVSCRQNTLNKEQRMAYLKAHVHNCQQMIMYNFFNFEIYKITYKGDADYFMKFNFPITKTRELYEINEEIYKLKKEEKEITDNHWHELKTEQEKTKLSIDSLIPPFFRQKINYSLETIHENDSEELAISKYFSNCQYLTQAIYETIKLTENPNIGLGARPKKYIRIQTSVDTVAQGEIFHAISTMALMEDFRNFVKIKSVHNIKPISLNDEKFKLEITGKNPSCTITYFDTRSLKEITHEIHF